MSNEKKIDDGGQAFPGGALYDPRRESVEHMAAYMDLGGMTLRDYFAAKALQGLLAKPDLRSEHTELSKIEQDFAACAYRMADAMLAMRKA